MSFFGSASQHLDAHSNSATSQRCVGLFLLASVTAFTPPVSYASDHNDIRVARYTTMSSAPTVSQIDPLEAIVQVNFPRTLVRNVGDATAYLLLRTGYHLAATEQLDEHVKHILALPLPEVHRTIGPYSVRNALTVLLGSPFALSVDSGRREVSYLVEGNHEKAMQPPDKNGLSTIPLASAAANAGFQTATVWRSDGSRK
jgi:conjugative transfer region protein (TIGR03748 family)